MKEILLLQHKQNLINAKKALENNKKEEMKADLEYIVKHEEAMLDFLENLEEKEDMIVYSKKQREDIYARLNELTGNCENPNVLKTPHKKMMSEIRETIHDYVVLDLETTGFSCYDDKIIDIGILKVRNDKVVDQYTQLINPMRSLDDKIVELTGIHDLMLIDAPVIDEVFEDVKAFIGEDIIMGHNVMFDIGFLNNIGNYVFKNNYIDTVKLAKKAYPGLSHHDLETMTRYLKLSKNTHRALQDVVSTKELYDAIVKKCGSVEATLIYKEEKKVIKKIKAEDFKEDSSSPLYNKNCIITGNPSRVDKATAYQIIERIGGHISKSLNKKTNYLIVGGFDNIKNMTGKKSSKMIKAEQLKEAGQDIEIITEADFYKILKV